MKRSQTAKPTTPLQRGIARIANGQPTQDGAGVDLVRYLPFPASVQLDPFLLLDVIKSDRPEQYIAGFPPHPHRGFETVTYLLAGRVRHRDSAGHAGVLKSGGVQWMTAGRGIEHSEIPEQESGLLFGFQLWINLPAAQKMQAPHYQEFEPEQIPVEQRSAGQSIRVIAGTTSEGTTGPVTGISAAPLFFDVQLAKDEHYQEQINPGYTAFLYIIEGEISIQGEFEHRTLMGNQLAVLGEGETLALKSLTSTRFLVIAGEPINEPIARHGPFVMNTQEQLVQAYKDYESGAFGHVEEAR